MGRLIETTVSTLHKDVVMEIVKAGGTDAKTDS